jgi:hypothetical protein
MATYIAMKISYVTGWSIHINGYKQMLKTLTFVSQFEIVVSVFQVGKEICIFLWALIIYS